MKSKKFCLFSFLALMAGAADNAPPPFVSPMFCDNMVLQRGNPQATLYNGAGGSAVSDRQQQAV